MRAKRIPLFVLLFLFAACLCSNVRMGILCRGWEKELAAAQRAAETADYPGAAAALGRLYTDWERRQVYLHIIVPHDEVDQAQELIDLCRLALQRQDKDAFLTTAVRLRSQLDLLREIEQLSIKNVL